MDPLTVTAGLLMLGLYLLRARIWPYGPCWKCKGSGKNAGSTKKRYGTCRRCKGSGRRIRFGTRFVFRKH